MDGFEHLRDGQVRHVRAERCHGEGAPAHAQQRCAYHGADLLRIGAECVGHAGSQQLLGSENGVDQRLKTLCRFGASSAKARNGVL